jgi:hypothetical protein
MSQPVRTTRSGPLPVCLATAFVLTLTQSVSVPSAWAQEKAMNLFKIVTVKDDIVIGLSDDELDTLGGRDAGSVAKALAFKGQMTVWQYAVRKNANGDLEQAPLRQVGLFANSSVRVEPYLTPLKVLSPE